MFIDERVFEIALARRGLSSIAVSVELGLANSTISRWKCGWIAVPEVYQSRLVEVLGVNKKKLFTKNNQKKSDEEIYESK